ncbi:Phage tail assembly chaperone [compost metagenome]
MNQLNAFVLVRVLFGEDGERLLSDEQVPELAANYGPVYDNLVAKAFDLSGLQAKAGADPVVEAGND